MGLHSLERTSVYMYVYPIDEAFEASRRERYWKNISSWVCVKKRFSIPLDVKIYIPICIEEYILNYLYISAQCEKREEGEGGGKIWGIHNVFYPYNFLTFFRWSRVFSEVCCLLIVTRSSLSSSTVKAPEGTISGDLCVAICEYMYTQIFPIWVQRCSYVLQLAPSNSIPDE